MRRLANVMGPAFNDLRPFARNLESLNESNIRFAEAVTPAIRDEIRPFVREARERVPDIRTGATRFAATVAAAGDDLQQAQPARQHGGLQPARCRARRHPGTRRGLPVLGQLAGATTPRSVFSSGDGNGFYRRVYLTMGCEQANAIDRRTRTRRSSALTQLLTGITDPVLAEVC